MTDPIQVFDGSGEDPNETGQWDAVDLVSILGTGAIENMMGGMTRTMASFGDVLNRQREYMNTLLDSVAQRLSDIDHRE